MAWQIKFDDASIKDLAKVDKPAARRPPPAARRITSFLRERVALLDDPRSIGEALKGSKRGELWKYRVGDYRIISSIEDGALLILVVRIGNRKVVYR